MVFGYYFFFGLQPAIVVILIASVGGKNWLRETTSATVFRANSSKALAKGVFSCKAAGLPTSPDSLILWIKGISPSNGVSVFSARYYLFSGSSAGVK